MSGLAIGIDFDNTIINYDSVIAAIALELGLEGAIGKEKIRDQIKERYSDSEWNRVQGLIYGPRINEATLIPGVEEYLDLCKTKGIETKLISHKSRYAKVQDVAKTDLRQAAVGWLKNKHLLGNYFKEADLYFEDDQQRKAVRVGTLGCYQHIDDLKEFFEHPNFPNSTTKILYSPHDNTKLHDLVVCTDWNQIADYTMQTLG